MQQDHQPKHEPGVSNAEAKKPERNSRVVAVVAWALNVLSSVSLIMTNKAVMSTFGFTFGKCIPGEQAEMNQGRHRPPDSRSVSRGQA